MNVLWETDQPACRRPVASRSRSLAYTTVQTIVERMHRKGKVKTPLQTVAYSISPFSPQRRSSRRGSMLDRFLEGRPRLVPALVETSRLTHGSRAPFRNAGAAGGGGR